VAALVRVGRSGARRHRLWHVDVGVGATDELACGLLARRLKLQAGMAATWPRLQRDVCWTSGPAAAPTLHALWQL
jgi:hypothetical protein